MNRKLKKIVSIILSISILLLNINYSLANDGSDSLVILETSTNITEVYVGDSFDAKLKYSYSHNDGTFLNERIKIVLGRDMSFSEGFSADSFEPNSDIDPSSFTTPYNDADDTPYGYGYQFVENGDDDYFVEFIVLLMEVDGMDSLSSSFNMKLEHDAGTGTKTGSTLSVTRVTDEGNTTTEYDNSVSVNVIEEDNNSWRISKSVISETGTTPMPNTEVTYRITVSGNNTVGGAILYDIDVVDELPEFATNVSYSITSNHARTSFVSFASDVITWNIPELLPGETFTYEVSLEYDDILGESKVNEVSATDDENDEVTATSTVVLTKATADATISKIK